MNGNVVMREPADCRLTPERLAWLRKLLEENKIHDFYIWWEWEKLRGEVLREQRSECQVCREKGKFTPATVVHHVNHLRRRPDLALSKWVLENGKRERNLIAVCAECHGELHGRSGVPAKEPLTPERW